MTELKNLSQRRHVRDFMTLFGSIRVRRAGARASAGGTGEAFDANRGDLDLQPDCARHPYGQLVAVSFSLNTSCADCTDLTPKAYFLRRITNIPMAAQTTRDTIAETKMVRIV